MAAGKFENITMKYTAGSEWGGPEKFEATGRGPDDGRGRFGDVTFYYKGSGGWTAFAVAQCGAYDHGARNEITNVQKSGAYPCGNVEVCVAFTSDNLPPNISSSVPQMVSFK
jgi:hypothetical protein